MAPAMLPGGFLARPFAHRALHGAAGAENSVEAIRAAVAAGWGIEIDVQLTADGRAAVFHDDALYRLTGRSGRVRDTAMADLAAIPLTGSGTIPALEDALAAAAGAPLLVEIKDQSGDMSAAGIGPLEAAVAAALGAHPGPVAVMSFNPHSVAAMATRAPALPRGLVTCAWEGAHWPEVPEARRAELRAIDLAVAGGAFVSHDRSDLASLEIARLKAAGTPILTWTIRSPEQEAEARTVADQITFEGYAPDA